MNDDDSSVEGVFDVERIVDDRMMKGRKQYLIKWVGYSESENTWEFEDNLMCEELLADYLKKKEAMEKRQKKPSSKRESIRGDSSTSKAETGPARRDSVAPKKPESTPQRKSGPDSAQPANKGQPLVQVVTNEWDVHIDKVIGASLNTDGTIDIEYLLKNGQPASSSSIVLRYKAPVKLIEFYEDNLTFPE